jgi:hypothetical protein
MDIRQEIAFALDHRPAQSTKYLVCRILYRAGLALALFCAVTALMAMTMIACEYIIMLSAQIMGR